MVDSIQDLLSSKKQHKELVSQLTEKAKHGGTTLNELIEILKTGRDVDKGTAAEVMKFISQENPTALAPYINVLIDNIDYKAPRVRWGCPEAIGYLAVNYPDQVAPAIPKLLENMKDPSTVVRWCAAFAISEIAKNNPAKQVELVSFMRGWIEKEQNNGVRNVFIKAVKNIEKQHE